MENRFLFRGKRIDNGEWIIGYFGKYRMEYLITIEDGACRGTDGMFLTGYPVFPETIGQCTGLKDKNGKLIFEGDNVFIQQNWLSNLTVKAIVKYEIPECGFYLHTELDEWFNMAEFGSDIEII